jgi:hypothetical protein
MKMSSQSQQILNYMNLGQAYFFMIALYRILFSGETLYTHLYAAYALQYYICLDSEAVFLLLELL